MLFPRASNSPSRHSFCKPTWNVVASLLPSSQDWHFGPVKLESERFSVSDHVAKYMAVMRQIKISVFDQNVNQNVILFFPQAVFKWFKSLQLFASNFLGDCIAAEVSPRKKNVSNQLVWQRLRHSLRQLIPRRKIPKLPRRNTELRRCTGAGIKFWFPVLYRWTLMNLWRIQSVYLRHLRFRQFGVVSTLQV